MNTNYVKFEKAAAALESNKDWNFLLSQPVPNLSNSLVDSQPVDTLKELLDNSFLTTTGLLALWCRGLNLDVDSICKLAISNGACLLAVNAIIQSIIDNNITFTTNSGEAVKVDRKAFIVVKELMGIDPVYIVFSDKDDEEAFYLTLSFIQQAVSSDRPLDRLVNFKFTKLNRPAHMIEVELKMSDFRLGTIKTLFKANS